MRGAVRATWAALLGLAAAAGTALAAPPDPIGPGVRDALARDGRVRVMIVVDAAPPSPSSPPRRGARPEMRETVDAILETLLPGDLRVERRFGAVAALAATLNERGLQAIARHPRTRRVDLDAPGRSTMLESRPLAQIDQLFDSGFTGSGALVAVLDTGVHLAHPDLGGAVVDEACFCSGGDGCCPNGQASQQGFGSAQDDHRHGSNVAGIIVSDGFVSPRGGAPDATLIAVKVLDSNATFCCSSDVVAGLDWLIQNHPDVDVVNLSLGTDALFAGACDDATAFTIAYAEAIGALRALGAITVGSSGNNGSGTQMVAPACIADTISVAAAWDASVGAQFVLGCADLSTQADKVTCYSNTNSQLDLVASGNPMTSAGYPANTSTFVGTSNASPLVSACAGLLRGLMPEIPANDLEAALRTSPVQVVDVTNGLSFPRLDCEAALTATGFQIVRVPALPAPATALLAALLGSGGVLQLARRRGPRRARQHVEEAQLAAQTRR